MKRSRSMSALPPRVRRALEKLGGDISVARRRRRLSMLLTAQRAFVSRNTVARVERGDPGVSLGIYASVLFVLGLSDRLADLADPASDRLGLTLEEQRLPRRIHVTPRRSARPHDGT